MYASSISFWLRTLFLSLSFLTSINQFRIQHGITSYSAEEKTRMRGVDRVQRSDVSDKDHFTRTALLSLVDVLAERSHMELIRFDRNIHVDWILVSS